MNYLATAARGTEPILARELRALGAAEVDVQAGAVAFEGPESLAWRANLWLRTANHVLRRLASFPVDGSDTLYAGALDVPWEDLLTTRTTFAVTVQGRTPSLAHSHFAALRVKDAVADRMRGRRGARPDVDPRDPDVRIVVHLGARGANLFLDTSGGSLHLRGWRVAATEAPLRETLAAAIVLWSGWDRRRPLADPLCGSGTIAIEAALLALDRAPGRRRRFGFQRWPSFGEAEAAAWRRLVEEADERARRTDAPRIAGSDRDGAAVAAARANAGAAGVARHVELAVADARRFEPLGPSGMIVFNPPYGERLAVRRERLEGLYRALGRSLRPPGHVAVAISGNAAFVRCFGARPAAHFHTFNGPLRCEVSRWDPAPQGD